METFFLFFWFFFFSWLMCDQVQMLRVEGIRYVRGSWSAERKLKVEGIVERVQKPPNPKT